METLKNDIIEYREYIRTNIENDLQELINNQNDTNQILESFNKLPSNIKLNCFKSILNGLNTSIGQESDGDGNEDNVIEQSQPIINKSEESDNDIIDACLNKIKEEDEYENQDQEEDKDNEEEEKQLDTHSNEEDEEFDYDEDFELVDYDSVSSINIKKPTINTTSLREINMDHHYDLGETECSGISSDGSSSNGDIESVNSDMSTNYDAYKSGNTTVETKRKYIYNEDSHEDKKQKSHNNNNNNDELEPSFEDEKEHIIFDKEEEQEEKEQQEEVEEQQQDNQPRTLGELRIYNIRFRDSVNSPLTSSELSNDLYVTPLSSPNSNPSFIQNDLNNSESEEE